MVRIFGAKAGFIAETRELSGVPVIGNDTVESAKCVGEVAREGVPLGAGEPTAVMALGSKRAEAELGRLLAAILR